MDSGLSPRALAQSELKQQIVEQAENFSLGKAINLGEGKRNLKSVKNSLENLMHNV